MSALHPGRRPLLPDTHAHLDAYPVEDQEDIVARAFEAGIDHILAVGEDLESSRRAIEISRAHRGVCAAVGLHPHRAERFEMERDPLRALLDSVEVVAVGEVGLDFHRGSETREAQLAAFTTQVKWAREKKLPVSVHNRAADADILNILTGSGVTAVLHCFSGTASFARLALDAGCYLSFAGNLTFPGASELRVIAAEIPLERILLESDAPVIAPQTHRGRRNEPSYLLETAVALAAVRDISLEEVAGAASANAARAFGWSES